MSSKKKQLMDSKVGNVLKAGIYTSRLPKYVPFFETHIDLLEASSVEQHAHIEKLEASIADLRAQVAAIERIQSSTNEKMSEFKHATLLVTNATTSSKTHTNSDKAVNDTMADDHSHDKFYKDFEDRFRGSEELIRERLKEYIPYLDSLPKALHKLPVLDIGCGRGEFLEVAKQAGFKAVGVDMNKDMVRRAKSLGYQAYENDALSYLIKQKSSSQAAISGFHLVEHIPFPVLLKIFEECYRTVHKDGFVLFETPNPNNLTVGASNFYMDPSHIKPIPPKLLSFALETQGFFTQVLELHPAHENIQHENPVIEDMMRMVYGPVDYAVLASKLPFKLATN